SKEEWNGQYKEASTAKEAVVNKDKDGAKGEVVEINAISGATITSRAVTRAVDGAMLLIASLSE
ncbi:MAG: FMN-binding protein, partial [Lachnospiraceae bacterium]|nr:FMN-binding protein [Lachnospiraceae bacterium]